MKIRQEKLQKIVIILTIITTGTHFFSIFYNSTDIFSNKQYDDEFKIDKVESAGTWLLSPFAIDDLGGGDYTWAEAVLEDWCSGSGTFSDPYRIENVTVNGGGVSNCIDILNSNVYFILENCVCYNSGVGTGPFFHAGIRFYNVSNAKLINNNCSYNGWSGIRIYYDCDNNTVIGNIANNNPDLGIYLRDGCNDNKVINNTCNDNGQWGIELYIDCDNNNITRNMVKSNDKVGIQINSGCDNNLIYNNSLIDNIQSNAKDDATTNSWNLGLLGNYWSDYGGVDADDDGIGDTSYSVTGSGGNQDNYPIWNDGFEGSPIFIDGDATGVGAHNWTWARTRIWCVGSGTENDPYIIQNLEIDGNLLANCINIENSNMYFIIRNCILKNGSIGIRLMGVSNGTINNNYVFNVASGIHIRVGSRYNTIIENNVSQCSVDGIHLFGDCDNNNITKNRAYNNSRDGITLINDCDYNYIYLNKAYNNSENGINIVRGSKNNLIYENNFSYNDNSGIEIDSAATGTPYSNDNNDFIDNTIRNNCYGIRLRDEDNKFNIFKENILFSNQEYALGINYESHDNLFYLNYIINNNGTPQALDNGTNTWDNNTIGNYWSDYGGYDTDDDGIGDTPYNIGGISGSQDNYPIWDDGDDLNPSIKINLPKPSQLNSTLAPSFNVEIFDPNLDTMWYTIDGGLTNITFIVNGTIDQNKWNTHPDGEITVIFYANDTLGHIASSQVIISKDTTDPLINIISPMPDQYFGINSPEFTVQIDDSNLDAMWYTIDGGLTNFTFTTNGTIDQNAWNAQPDGPVTIIFYSNDTLGHLNFSQVVINKLTQAITINIISPSLNQLFNSIAPDFIVELSGANANILWYTIDNGLNNITFVSNGTIDQTAWSSKPDGSISIKFYANDSLGIVYSAVITIEKDTEAPIITIVDPSLNDVFEFAPAYELSITESNLDTIWYTLDGETNNFTVSGLTGIINQELWESLPNGYVTIRFYANDTLGHVNFDEVIIVKETPTPSPQPPGIPGYDLFVLLGVIGFISVISIKFKARKQN